MKIDFYTGAKIYLIIVLIFSITLIVFEAYKNNNWYILAFLPIIFMLWWLNLAFLGIDYKYHGHD